MNRFINKAKQFMFLHKILRANFSFTQIDDVIEKIEKKYGENNWDFATIANWLEKGA